MNPITLACTWLKFPITSARTCVHLRAPARALTFLHLVKIHLLNSYWLALLEGAHHMPMHVPSIAP